VKNGAGQELVFVPQRVFTHALRTGEFAFVPNPVYKPGARCFATRAESLK
jgi:hypothetical protein